jgi:parvulin-like peptidyl-prolyl isomerase
MNGNPGFPGKPGAVSYLKPELIGLASVSSEASTANADKKPNASPQDRVVANVNGVDINESEVLPIMAAGVDRAVAIDRYINKVLAAQLAEKEYQKDAQVALRAAEREVLSTLYMQKRTQAVNDGVTDEQIKSYYDKNVRDEDYKRYKLRYYLTQDVNDGENTAKAILNKERDALAKLKYMKEGTDNMLMAGEMPYGLGQVVRSLKEGETSRPIVLRNGVFVLNLEEVKAQPKPTVDKVKGEIKNLLVAEKIGAELNEQRKNARIELK